MFDLDCFRDFWLHIIRVLDFIFYDDRRRNTRRSETIFLTHANNFGSKILDWSWRLVLRLVDWHECIIRVMLLIIVQRHLVATSKFWLRSLIHTNLSQLLLVSSDLLFTLFVQSFQFFYKIILLLQLFLFCNEFGYYVAILLVIQNLNYIVLVLRNIRKPGVILSIIGQINIYSRVSFSVGLLWTCFI